MTSKFWLLFKSEMHWGLKEAWSILKLNLWLFIKVIFKKKRIYYYLYLYFFQNQMNACAWNCFCTRILDWFVLKQNQASKLSYLCTQQTTIWTCFLVLVSNYQNLFYRKLYIMRIYTKYLFVYKWWAYIGF